MSYIPPSRAAWLAVALSALLWGLLIAAVVCAGGIPAQAQRHRATLIRDARLVFGMNAPISTFAGQIHQESRWNERAVSPAGAQGLAQFMPSTARWMPQIDPQSGKPAPYNPAWSIRAMIVYDDWLLAHVSGVSQCDRWMKALAAYNGGLGWVYRDERLATRMGRDAGYWSEIADINAGRSAANFRENRGYPVRILTRWTPMYQAAGWGRGGCDE